MLVYFTQYQRPDGRTREINIAMPDELEPKVKEILAEGCKLTIEALSTGEVSLAVEHPDHGDVCIEITPNGPEVPLAVRKLIEGFSKDLCRT